MRTIREKRQVRRLCYRGLKIVRSDIKAGFMHSDPAHGIPVHYLPETVSRYRAILRQLG